MTGRKPAPAELRGATESAPEAIDWPDVARQLELLYEASSRLEAIFPGRKFTLDGHLVGSVGEVVAAYMFDLILARGSSLGHDAHTKNGMPVEIKLTQGAAIAIRHQPSHLVVLHRNKVGPLRVVFNGPGELAWASAGTMASNGQRPIRLSRLAVLDQSVSPELRLPIVRPAPI